jgi:hypothetical protein
VKEHLLLIFEIRAIGEFSNKYNVWASVEPDKVVATQPDLHK